MTEMADDSSQDDFGRYLKDLGLAYETVQDGDKLVFKVAQYVILHGRYAGKVIGIGFPLPKDYPVSAPYGIHVKADGVFTEPISGLNGSNLGSDWKFWSRTIPSWQPGKRNSAFYVDYANRWLEVS